ncbi:DUF11 domain-containing protein [Candidatus Saccharibacteria bacterium]|nr:DUF11 domain-containing protein [Candidatus Saccharibacteria bacterium]
MKDKKKKKIIISAMLLGLLVNVVKITTVAAWGPERTTYTNESPAPKAVFNSITNNAAVGDERNFVRIVEVDPSGAKHEYMNEVDVSGGHDYEVYIYYHNNASETYNDKEHEYVGVARDTKLATSFPTSLKAGEAGTVSATISASNTLVEKVWDEAFMKATEDVTLAYISASAKIYNDWNKDGTVLSTDLFNGEGTYLGLKSLNGVILGCDRYSGYILYRIRATKVAVEPEPEPERPEETTSGFSVDKQVSKDGGVTWTDNVSVTPGETLEFRVSYKNTGTVAQTGVTISDTLEGAAGTEYVAGSTRIVRGETETIVQDADGTGLFSGGLVIGTVAAGEEIEIHYKVKIQGTDKFACGKTVLYNLAGVSGKRADDASAGVASRYDKVQIEVIREDEGCLPAEIPETGPAQIILASVVSLGLLVGMGYWLNSKHQLRKLEQQAKGLDKNQ